MNMRLVLILGLLALMAVAWWAAFTIYRAAELGEQAAPLAPREWPGLTVITVGTGSDYENPERLGPVTAVAWGSNVVLVDAGRGVCEALRRAQIPMTQPETLLLTNLLPHNVVGLDDLLYCGWLQDRERALRVVGPPGTLALVEGLRTAHAQGAAGLGRALPLFEDGGRLAAVEVGGADGASGLAQAEETEDGIRFEIDGVTISAVALPGGPVPALAWRFDRGRRSVVVSGTGWAPDVLSIFAKDADLLVHEAVYIPSAQDIEDAQILADPDRLAAEARIHTALESVGDLASRAGVRELILVRLRPPPFFELQFKTIVGQKFDGVVHVPVDGDEIVP